MRMIRNLVLAPLLGGSVSLILSCSDAGAIPDHPPRAVVACEAPIEILAVDDQTGSMKDAGTRSFSADDLDPLFDRLVECGGSIGVYFVRDRPDKGVNKIRFVEPPPAPAEPRREPHEEEYEFSDRRAEYEVAIGDRTQQIEANRTKYLEEFMTFKARLMPLIERKPAGSTDLNSALNVADVYLSQDRAWTRPSTKVLILISDGADTNRKARFPFRSGARILWVNSLSNAKVLSDLNAERFQDFDSAARTAIDQR